MDVISSFPSLIQPVACIFPVTIHDTKLPLCFNQKTWIALCSSYL